MYLLHRDFLNDRVGSERGTVMKEYILRENAEKRVDDSIKRIFAPSKGLGKQIVIALEGADD